MGKDSSGEQCACARGPSSEGFFCCFPNLPCPASRRVGAPSPPDLSKASGRSVRGNGGLRRDRALLLSSSTPTPPPLAEDGPAWLQLTGRQLPRGRATAFAVQMLLAAGPASLKGGEAAAHFPQGLFCGGSLWEENTTPKLSGGGSWCTQDGPPGKPGAFPFSCPLVLRDPEQPGRAALQGAAQARIHVAGEAECPPPAQHEAHVRRRLPQKEGRGGASPFAR